MKPVIAKQSAVIDAPPAEVYAVLADYRSGHPAILPRQFFEEVRVEEGGTGAGTVIRVAMNVYGVRRSYHMTVAEPEPGRVLSETDSDAQVVTIFTVEPISDGKKSLVTIATESPAAAGVVGFVERRIQPIIMRRIFRRQLRMLADYLRNNRGENAPP